MARRLACVWVCLVCSIAIHAVRAADHPLEPLSAAETKRAFEVVLARFRSDPALPHEPLRFPLVALLEPPKTFVLGWSPGQPFPRHAQLQVLHYPSDRLWIAEVDLEQKQLVRLDLQVLGTQAAISADEYRAIDVLVHDYEPWRRALRERNIDPALAYVDTWAPGDAPVAPDAAPRLSFGPNTRLARCLTFLRGTPTPSHMPQNPYARPIEGLLVTIDLNARKVLSLIDSGARAVSSETGNAHTKLDLKPLVVSEPRGSDIERKGRLVHWHHWQFYVALHPREGLVLYDVRFEDHGVLRPIAYRLSLSEIYVPYALGDPNWIWRSAFDVGEYNAGTLAQRLVVNRDVPENAQLIDATFFSDVGPSPDNPNGTLMLPATIALFERDSGVLWTRTDPTTSERDTRYGRELVAMWNCWLGNYVYAFEWIFKLDGTIEVQVKLTGNTLNRGANEVDEASSPKVGKDAHGAIVSAPDHQHFLNFRLDLDIDGVSDQVMEMESARIAADAFKNAFGALTTRLDREGFRDVNALTARHWHVESASQKNPFGKPTGYALEPESFAIPYYAPDFPGLTRAQFARHQFWVTRYRDDERYAAGDFPNQAKRAAGLAAYTSPPEAISGQDVVVWFSTGFTHISRPEDYPVMPTETIRFRLEPRGFFAQNPALEVADQAVAH